MVRFISYFLPEKFRSQNGSDEVQRAQMLVVAVFVTLIINLGSSTVYYRLGSVWLGHLSMLQCIGCLFSLVILNVFKSLEWSMLWLLGMLTIMFMALSLFTGGVFSILIFSLYIPPILALVFFRRRVMLIIFATEVFFILAMMLLEFQKVPLPFINELAGKPLWHAWISIALITGVVFSFFLADKINLTAKKTAEEERDSVKEKIRQATQALEEQNIHLQKAIYDAKQAQQFQTDFLRNVSHEVRTPLAAIMGFSEILSNRTEPPSESVRLEFARQIGYAGEQLHEIFNNLVMLSQLENSDMEVCIEPVHLPSIFRDIGSQYKLQAEKKGLQCSIQFDQRSSELIVTTDARHLGVIIRQLLSNAVKFTEKGSIVVDISMQDTSSDYPVDIAEQAVLSIVVRDTGVGITKGHLERLFKPFQQQDTSKNRQFGGLGLGLAISLRLVKVLKGQLSCTSEVHSGSTFVVAIPVNVLYT